MITRHKEFNFKKMVMHSLDLMGSVDPEGCIQYVNDAYEAILGYDSRELQGRHYSEFIHPDDLPAARRFIQSGMQGQGKGTLENRYLHKKGHAVPIRWSFVWSEDDGHLFCIGRDITAQKAAEYRLEESEKRYRSLFDNSPDILFVENRQGLITQVNKRFNQVFQLSAAQVTGSPACCFLSAEMATVNEKKLQQAFLGNTTRFDLQLWIAGESRIYDTTKHPIIVNDEIIGMQTIARDITPAIRSLETIQRQANKLNTIFESMTDGFLSLDRDWNLTYMNSEAARLLQLGKEDIVGKNFWEQLPEEVNGIFYQRHHQALKTGQPVQFEAYYSKVDKWFGVKSFPSEEGLSVYFEDVTEKVKYRKELEMLSLVASHTTNSVLMTDKERRIEWVNEGFTRITGYSLEEAAGKFPLDLLYNPKAPVNAYELVKPRLLAGERVVFEMLTSKKNGEDMWSYVQIIPIRDEAGEQSRYITIQADFTESVKTRQELEKLSLVASRANNSVLIADKNYRIEWANAGFTRLLGYSLEEARGKTPLELLHSGKINEERFSLLKEQLLRGEPISFEIRYAKKNGEEIWLSVENNAIFDEGGQLSGFIEVQTDITALKESEMALAQSAQDLCRQNKDLQQFAYIVSHNLRAPVANVLGLTDLLSSVEKDSEVFESSLSKLKQSTFNLDTVIRDMNTILNIRESKENLEQEQVTVMLVLQQALSFLQEPLQNCGGRVTFDLAEGFSVRANKAYLYSICYNLLSNAIKYRSPERTLEVHIKGEDHPEKGAILSFADNGSGFDMQKVSNKVFKLYNRFHPDRPGRGIGLYLIKAHLEAMDGSIEVNSQVGCGTNFLVYLPGNPK
jgi:PAS domain S-box-containing protein